MDAGATESSVKWNQMAFRLIFKSYRVENVIDPDRVADAGPFFFALFRIFLLGIGGGAESEAE